MLRLAEILLFLAPFAAFAVWRFSAAQGGPSPVMLGAAACGLVLLAAVLYWQAVHNEAGPGSVYVPARFQNGRIIPGHVTRP